jgi:hypothetical protein
MYQPKPIELLAAARMILRREDLDTAGLWPRAAALLARQALEDAVEGMWTGATAGMERCNKTQQLLCLTDYLGDPALGREAYVTWCALSEACHHHPYELAPTVGELERRMSTVERLIGACAAV